LRSLYERANWWPKGAPSKPVAKPAAVATTPPPAAATPPPPAEAHPSVGIGTATPADTHRDLAAIAEINRVMYRQSTPREVLTTTATEIGKHLGVTRCVVMVGGSGDAQLTAEYGTPGIPIAGAPRISALAQLISKLTPDALGGIELNVNETPSLRDLGLQTALGVVLMDKETQMPSGALIVGAASGRRWKPNESFFLQAVGDQLVLSVNHTRLRSLVRSLAVADERTGLLSRSAYVDCLLMESSRARSQGTAISLIVLHVDRGGDLLRQHGDAPVDQFIEQLARAVSGAVRQTDVAVKYTAWSLVFILPDTAFDNAKALAEKLRQVASTVEPSWGKQDMTISAVVAQATARPSDENEDRVTEWMNRAEAGLDEARQRGGNTLVELATP
jgi:diguanylate cyclase (GGDEF)-like protein